MFFNGFPLTFSLKVYIFGNFVIALNTKKDNDAHNFFKCACKRVILYMKHGISFSNMEHSIV